MSKSRVTNRKPKEKRDIYCGPEELETARAALDAVMGGLGGIMQGRLMSALDDIWFVMESFMMTKKEIEESEAEEIGASQGSH